MRLPLLLALACLESFSVILLERGIYFYTGEVLGFGGRANLALALVFGLAYVVGAQGSHRLCRRIPERTLLTVCLLLQTAVHGMLTLSPGGAALWTGMGCVGFLNGLKWPLLESFVSAGKTHAAQAKAVGAFNLAWSIPVPLSLGVTGWLVAFHPSSMFALAMLSNLAGLPLLMGFPARPAPAPPEGPDALAEASRPRWQGLLRASRWSMLSGYVLLFILSPLLPGIFRDLGVPVVMATPLAAVLDVCRVLCFLALRTWTAWHGRRAALAAAWIGLPLGLTLCLASGSVAAVLAGQIVFGLAMGLAYYASLYYAMALHGGSVEAGGDHEALIGGGFAIGPALGLLGLGALGMQGVLAGGLVLAAGATLLGVRCLRNPQGLERK